MYATNVVDSRGHVDVLLGEYVAADVEGSTEHGHGLGGMLIMSVAADAVVSM